MIAFATSSLRNMVKTVSLFAVSMTFLLAVPQRTCLAQQRGQILEGVLRTLGEAAVERERRKRLEEERRLREAQQVEQFSDPRDLQLPTELRRQEYPLSSSQRNRNPDVLARDDRSSSIEVRSRQALRFAQDLVAFQQNLDALTSDLRTRPAPRPLRQSLPQLVQLSAVPPELLRRMNGVANLDRITNRYVEFDARWRTLSHEIRPYTERDSRRAELVDELDRLANRLIEQLDIEPQFNRGELLRLMTSAGAYMQVLLDDLALLDQRSRRDRMSHRIRVLREQLLLEAENLEELDAEEIVDRFQQFVSDWRPLAEQIGQLNDAHTLSRLERLRETAIDAYRLLRLEPPSNVTNPYALDDDGRDQQPADLRRLVTLAATVEGGSRTLKNRIERLSDRVRPRSFANEIKRLSEQVARHAEHLHDELTRDDPHRERLVEEMEKVAEDWRGLSNAIDRLDRSGSDSSIERLRQVKQELEPAIARLAVALLGDS